MEEKRMIKNRNILLVYVFGLITLGIYFIYWYVSTKKDMNSMGASIPTAWLLIIPIVNIYWGFKYCEAFSKTVRKDNKLALWFVLYLLVGIVMPAIVQSELNKSASGATGSAPAAMEAPVKTAPVAAKPVVA